MDYINAKLRTGILLIFSEGISTTSIHKSTILVIVKKKSSPFSKKSLLPATVIARNKLLQKPSYLLMHLKEGICPDAENTMLKAKFHSTVPHLRQIILALGSATPWECFTIRRK